MVKVKSQTLPRHEKQQRPSAEGSEVLAARRTARVRLRGAKKEHSGEVQKAGCKRQAHDHSTGFQWVFQFSQVHVLRAVRCSIKGFSAHGRSWRTRGVHGDAGGSSDSSRQSLFGREGRCSERVQLPQLRGRRRRLLPVLHDHFCEGHRPEVIYDPALSESGVERSAPGLPVGRLVPAVRQTLVLRVEGPGSKGVHQGFVHGQSSSSVLAFGHGDVHADVLLGVRRAQELVAALRVSPADLLVSADPLGRAVTRLVGLAASGGRPVVALAIAGPGGGVLPGFPLAC